MNELSLRRRLAASVMAALLAISGAALATAVLASDDRAARNTGDFLGVLKGGDQYDRVSYDGNDVEIYTI